MFILLLIKKLPPAEVRFGKDKMGLSLVNSFMSNIANSRLTLSIPRADFIIPGKVVFIQSGKLGNPCISILILALKCG